jgi:uncharacterized protein (DUF885 family)
MKQRSWLGGAAVLALLAAGWLADRYLSARWRAGAPDRLVAAVMAYSPELHTRYGAQLEGAPPFLRQWQAQAPLPPPAPEDLRALERLLAEARGLDSLRLAALAHWLRQPLPPAAPDPAWQLRAAVELLLFEQPARSFADCEQYVNRVRAFPDAWRAASQDWLRRAQLSPADTFRIRQELEAFAALPPAENPLYLMLARRMGRVDPTDINEYKAVDLLQKMERYLRQGWVPSCRELLAELPAAGSPSRPGAQAALAAAGIRLPADSLLGQALRAAALRGLRADRLLDSLGTGSGTRSERLRRLCEAAPAPPQDAAGRRRWLDSTGARIQENYTAAQGLFETMPARKLSLESAPAPFPPGSSLLRYAPASPDGYREGALYLDLASPRPYRRWMLPIELAAVGFPGLHLWHARRAGPPTPGWQKMIVFPACEVGWSSYAVEALGEELLYFSGSAEMSLRYEMHSLEQALHAAADLALAQGLWTEAQAREALLESLPLEEGEAEGLLAELRAFPGQRAAAWAVGQALGQLRRAQASQAGFRLQAFHEQLLNAGPMPLFLWQSALSAPALLPKT